jgi:hypothetical protein
LDLFFRNIDSCEISKYRNIEVSKYRNIDSCAANIVRIDPNLIAWCCMTPPYKKIVFRVNRPTYIPIQVGSTGVGVTVGVGRVARVDHPRVGVGHRSGVVEPVSGRLSRRHFGSGFDFKARAARARVTEDF